MYYENKSETEEQAECRMAFYLDLASVSDGTIDLLTAKLIGVEKYDPLNSRVELKDTCKDRRRIEDDLPF